MKCKARELICRRSCDACWAGEWRGEVGRMVSVQGAFPHSTACQSRYLSASNRGTGEDRQHLLSKPNYLLSTKQRGEPTPQPAMSSHIYTYTCNKNALTISSHLREGQQWFIYLFIYLLTLGNSEVSITKLELQLIWKYCWIKGEYIISWCYAPQRSDSFMTEGMVRSCWATDAPHVPRGKLCSCVGGTESLQVNIWHLESN